MRRGYRPEWDNTERAVWTGWAVAWVVALIAVIACIIPARLGDTGAQGLGVFLLYTVCVWMLLAHVLTFALMWLRKLLVSPTGKERDR